MELEQYVEKFREQGYGVCSILYDSEAILADFAKRKNITFPMLSDVQSSIIREFGILNTHVSRDHFYYGIPYPGTYVVDREGILQTKYFPDSFRDRVTAPTILLREFGSQAGTRETRVETDHLELKYYSTQDVVHPSLRLTLVAGLDLKPKMHVYAPTVQGYIPIQLELEPSSEYVVHAAEYPTPDNDTLARHPGNRPGLSRSIPGDAGYHHGANRCLAADFLRKPGVEDSRSVSIPGLRRQDLLPASGYPSGMESDSASARTRTCSGADPAPISQGLWQGAGVTKRGRRMDADVGMAAWERPQSLSRIFSQSCRR